MRRATWWVLALATASVNCHEVAEYGDSERDDPADAAVREERCLSGADPPADLPPGSACRFEDERLVTAEGGCCDRASGLVWSALSVATMTWHEAVWDAARASSPAPDEYDLGRTNDYPEVAAPCSDLCDGSAMAYCHGLTEGGQKDWRLPGLAELTGLYGRMANAGAVHLANAGDDLVVWSADSNAAGYTTTIDLGTGETVLGKNKNLQRRVECVRGGRRPARRIEVLGGPAAVGAGQSLPGPLRVAIRDEQGSQINAQGVELQLSADGGGLAGAISALTDIVGVAELTGWTIDVEPPATVSLEIHGGDLLPAVHELVVGPYRHTCRLEDDRFRTAEGGCKDLLSGLVWSAPSPMLLSWDEAIWDAQSPPGNVPADDHDQGRTNDYDGTSRFTDGSTANYCHELEEGGQGDWRMPTSDELITVARFGEGAPEHFGFDADLAVHASTTSASSMNARVNLASGAITAAGRAARSAPVICVRQGS
jgi:hypothetical protein